MLLKNSYYTFQEILNMYPTYAPSNPHDTTINDKWFTLMIAEADLNVKFYNLNVTFTIEFGKIAENFRSFLSTAIRTSKTLDETLFNVDNGVDALIELIQYIDSDPSSLLQGKKKLKSDANEKDGKKR